MTAPIRGGSQRQSPVSRTPFRALSRGRDPIWSKLSFAPRDSGKPKTSLLSLTERLRVDAKTQARIGYNEALFRAVNEEIEALVPKRAGVAFEIVCECGDIGCRKMISVTPQAYASVRSKPDRFFVRADHEIEEVETVVEVVEGSSSLDTYYVVEKDEGIPQRVAELTDPRG